MQAEQKETVTWHHASSKPSSMLALLSNALFCLVFMDIKNACCSLLRSLVVEFGESDDMFAHIVKELKLPPDLLEELMFIVRTPPSAS